MIQRGELTFYTFKIGTNAEGIEFYNLVVAVNNIEEIISMRILEYIPYSTWLEDTSQPFNGEVRIQENDIFSVNDINNILSAKSGSNQCVSGVTGEWECNEGNNHAPGGGTTCTSSEYIITVHWGPCPEIIDAGGSSGGGGGFPVDPGSSTGGGGGTTDNGTDNTNDNENSPEDNENCILDADGNCLVDDTTPMPPKDPAEDDCNTSKEDLKKIFPEASDEDMETLATVINDYGTDFDIDTKEKLQHFLAQAGHEVGEFANGLSATESLYYTTKARLLKIFYPYFSETDTIKKRKPDTYLRNSSKVANYVYSSRMGNGNEASEDGYKYRGRGIFQLTGKNNYTAFKTWYNNKYDPDKDFVATPNLITSNDTLSILSALWFYKTSVLDKITVDSTTTSLKVTKKVNGGTNGKDHRKEIFDKAKDSITCK